MILDFVPKTGAFVLKVGRGEADPKALMLEHGLTWSSTASSGNAAVLFTKEPYAACPFEELATPLARQQLASLLAEIALSKAKVSNAHIRCPADQELLPFQKADVEYALRRKNTLVGDQPGLGKTPVAICFANEIGAKRVLVICPANIRLQWAKRIREWSVMRWPYVVYPILTGSRGVNPTAEWTIVSYDLSRTVEIGSALARGTYDLIIIDEAHYVKTIDSNRTKALFGDHTGFMRRPIRDDEGSITGHEVLFEALSSRCGAILALTGTPLPNRPREAYVLAKNLCHESIDWMSEDSFTERFNPSAVVWKTVTDKITGEKREVPRTVEKAGRHGELQARLRVNFMVRHEKDDEIRKQMKMSNRPRFDIVQIEPNAAVAAALKAERMLDINPEDEKLFAQQTFENAGHIASVRRQMGVAMAPLVANYIEMLIDGGEEKLSVFAWHIAVLDILQRRLAKYGLTRIDGRVGAAKKQDLVNEWIANPKLNVILGNMQSMGTGTDGLQEVSWHALIVEADWVSGNNQQAVDRLDRFGQERTVQADFLVAPGSIGETVLASSLRKLIQTDKVLDRTGWRT